MLNDWHHTVDMKLAVLDERLKWVLRIAAASLAFGIGERIVPTLASYLAKLIGG